MLKVSKKYDPFRFPKPKGYPPYYLMDSNPKIEALAVRHLQKLQQAAAIFRAVKHSDVVCEKCSWLGLNSELAVHLQDIENLAKKLKVGGEVPVGECPVCGGLVYLLEKKKSEGETQHDDPKSPVYVDLRPIPLNRDFDPGD